MPRWSVKMAKLLKDRENPDYFGTVIGTVEQVAPLKISIYEKQIIFDDENIYLCKSVTKHTEQVNGTINGGNYTGTVNYTGAKQGDKVICIISEDNQNIFVIDVAV